MKRFFAIISMALILAVLASTVVFAAEEAKLDAVKMEKYGQKTYYVGDPVDIGPVSDGTIEDGEYTYSVKIEEPDVWLADKNSNKKGMPEDLEPWMYSDSITLHYAYDEDYIYLGFYDVQGYKDSTHWIYRNNYVLRFGFNLADSAEYIQFSLTGNWGDYTTVKQIPSIGMSSPGGNTALSDDEAFIISAYATKTHPEDPREDLKATDAAPWVRQYEVTLSKEKILEAINFYCGTEYAELSNAMLFSLTTLSYREYAETAIADDNARIYSMWNCAELSDEQMNELGTEFIYVPNVIVFGKELVPPVMKSDEPEVTEAVEGDEPEDDATEPSDESAEPTDDAVATDAPAAKDEEKGGCAASVGAVGIALVMTLGSAACVVSKKRIK